MVTIAEATAYIISKANKEGKITKLGKTKIFKTLYLADWRYFAQNGEILFDIEWYRIQKGPALKQYQWDELCQILFTKYNVTSRWETLYHNQVVFHLETEISFNLSQETQIHLDSAFDDVIDITAPEAANLTYDTEPMKWIVGHEAALGNNVQFTEFVFNDPDRIKFKKLAEDYMQGKVDIPKIANNMGRYWTENKVVLFLELLETNRPLSKTGISDKNKKEILSKLLKLAQTENPEFADSKYVEAEVIASQRIEGIHVSPDAFVEEF